jgi:hypothetical protein
MSVLKYSANPAQTPAIFFSETMRRSFFGAAAAGGSSGLAGFPQDVQKRAASGRLAPH